VREKRKTQTKNYHCVAPSVTVSGPVPGLHGVQPADAGGAADAQPLPLHGGAALGRHRVLPPRSDQH